MKHPTFSKQTYNNTRPFRLIDFSTKTYKETFYIFPLNIRAHRALKNQLETLVSQR